MAMVKTELKEFVKETAADQEARTQHCFEELKQLLLLSNQEKSSAARPAKKSKAGKTEKSDIAMEEDDI